VVQTKELLDEHRIHATRRYAGRRRADPSKHVNYTFGMLLGVDDFKQEFAYLSGRDHGWPAT